MGNNPQTYSYNFESKSLEKLFNFSLNTTISKENINNGDWGKVLLLVRKNMIYYALNIFYEKSLTISQNNPLFQQFFNSLYLNNQYEFLNKKLPKFQVNLDHFEYLELENEVKIIQIQEFSSKHMSQQGLQEEQEKMIEQIKSQDQRQHIKLPLKLDQTKLYSIEHFEKFQDKNLENIDNFIFTPDNQWKDFNKFAEFLKNIPDFEKFERDFLSFFSENSHSRGFNRDFLYGFSFFTKFTLQNKEYYLFSVDILAEYYQEYEDQGEDKRLKTELLYDFRQGTFLYAFSEKTQKMEKIHEAKEIKINEILQYLLERDIDNLLKICQYSVQGSRYNREEWFFKKFFLKKEHKSAKFFLENLGDLNLKIGSVLRVYRQNYWHAGVYLGGDLVIHVQVQQVGEKGNLFQYDQLGNFIKDSEIMQELRFCLFEFDKQEIVEKSLKMNKEEIQYCVTESNCEHYAFKLVTGLQFSPQLFNPVKNILSRFVKGSVVSSQ